MNNQAFEAVVREQIARWRGHPSYAWAGECGIFADYVWTAAKALGVDVPMDSFDNSRHCDTALEPLPGISFEELDLLEVSQGLNHVWLVWEGQYYDAAHPEGVSSPLHLRCVRQALVEMLQLRSSQRLSLLCKEHPYWAESMRLAEEFAAVCLVREAQYEEN